MESSEIRLGEEQSKKSDKSGGGLMGIYYRGDLFIYVLQSGPLKKMTKFKVGRGTKAVGSV